MPTFCKYLMLTTQPLFKKIITCDKSKSFQFNTKTSQYSYSIHYNTCQSSRIINACQSKFKSKTMLVFFIYLFIYNFLNLYWVTRGTRMNQRYNYKILTNLRIRVRKNQPELWKIRTMLTSTFMKKC